MRDELRRTLQVLAEQGQSRDPDQVFLAATQVARRRQRRTLVSGTVAGVAVAILAVGPGLVGKRNDTRVAVGSGATTVPPGTIVPGGPAASERDRLMVAGLIEFAREVGPPALTFAEEGVQLGLGEDLITRRAPSELNDPAQWVLATQEFRSHVGPFSALTLLRESRSLDVSVGPHPHCASAPVPPPAGVAHLRRVSVHPDAADGCLGWFTVDIYVDAEGIVHAVTLDLWAP